MAPRRRLRDRILDDASDTGIDFDRLCRLLRALGFNERTRGSHHIFTRTGVQERVNLQHDGRHAKPYQVAQVREILIKYRLLESNDDESPEI